MHSVLCTLHGDVGLLPEPLWFATDQPTSRSDGIARLKADHCCLLLWKRVSEFAADLFFGAVAKRRLDRAHWRCVCIPGPSRPVADAYMSCVMLPRARRATVGRYLRAARRISAGPRIGFAAAEGGIPRLRRPKGIIITLCQKCSTVFITGSNQPPLLIGARAHWIIAFYAGCKLSVDAVVTCGPGTL